MKEKYFSFLGTAIVKEMTDLPKGSVYTKEIFHNPGRDKFNPGQGIEIWEDPLGNEYIVEWWGELQEDEDGNERMVYPQKVYALFEVLEGPAVPI